MAITIDDGPDPEVTPQVLAQLERDGPAPRFFASANASSATRIWRRKSCARGHAIENHSQRHRHDFSLLGPSGMSAEIARAQDSIVRVTGEHAAFFRAPAGLRNPFLDPVLVPPCSCGSPAGRGAASIP